MTYTQAAAATSQTALMDSPREVAITLRATAPKAATRNQPNFFAAFIRLHTPPQWPVAYQFPFILRPNFRFFDQGGARAPEDCIMESVTLAETNKELRTHLFYETSHSPSLADLVGYEQAKRMIDFCFIANPYYPTPAMLQDLQENIPNLIKSYPSSNPLISQKNLAAVLGVNPENLIIGNGATELIVLINTLLIDRIAVPVPTFGEYIEKLRDQRDAELYPLDPEQGYQLDPPRYLAWVQQQGLKALLVINPGNPT